MINCDWGRAIYLSLDMFDVQPITSLCDLIRAYAGVREESAWHTTPASIVAFTLSIVTNIFKKLRDFADISDLIIIFF